jgi:hypothetical protein
MESKLLVILTDICINFIEKLAFIYIDFLISLSTKHALWNAAHLKKITIPILSQWLRV